MQELEAREFKRALLWVLCASVVLACPLVWLVDLGWVGRSGILFITTGWYYRQDDGRIIAFENRSDTVEPAGECIGEFVLQIDGEDRGLLGSPTSRHYLLTSLTVTEYHMETWSETQWNLGTLPADSPYLPALNDLLRRSGETDARAALHGPLPIVQRSVLGLLHAYLFLGMMWLWSPGSLAVCAVFLYRAFRRRRWIRHGRCWYCGYDLRGAATDDPLRCPECGRAWIGKP
jgi:hypothetical protein